MFFTAKEVAEILQREGLNDITSRTVNYYAFDKKMFDINKTGKKCFTKEEINKIKCIKKLQESTNFTLQQIKDIINKYTYEDIMSRFSSVSYNNLQTFETSYNSAYATKSMNICSNAMPSLTSQYRSLITNSIQTEETYNKTSLQRNIRVNEDITLTISENIDTETLQKIIKNINTILKEK